MAEKAVHFNHLGDPEEVTVVTHRSTTIRVSYLLKTVEVSVNPNARSGSAGLGEGLKVYWRMDKQRGTDAEGIAALEIQEVTST